MYPATRSAAIGIAMLVVSCSVNVCTSTARAEAMNHGKMIDGPSAPPSVGQTLFDTLTGLIGTWDAQTKDGVMTDTFKPFAFKTAILGEEWMNGMQITSTIFYVVNGELRADHYCDLKNQPRYTAVPALDPAVLDFEFRDATNLDTHPVHFHGSKWQIIDSTHLVQDWFVMGGSRPVSLMHMEFVKRADGEPTPQSDLAPPKTG